MFPTDLRKFNFYPKYIWSATDFTNFQDYVYGGFRGTFAAYLGASILDGLKASAAGGLNVQITAGIAANEDGRFLRLLVNGTVALPSPVGNAARHLVVLRPLDTPATLIPEPLNPANNVPLHVKQEAQLVVIPGTPAANPVYPATLAGDVVVAGLYLIAGQSVITASDFERTMVDAPKKRMLNISEVEASRTIDSAEHVVEGDCAVSGLTLTLPPAAQAAGTEFVFVKVDPSANPLTIAGQGGELISGQSTQIIDDQWGTLKIYSNGLSYRAV